MISSSAVGFSEPNLADVDEPMAGAAQDVPRASPAVEPHPVQTPGYASEVIARACTTRIDFLKMIDPSAKAEIINAISPTSLNSSAALSVVKAACVMSRRRPDIMSTLTGHTADQLDRIMICAVLESEAKKPVHHLLASAFKELASEIRVNKVLNEAVLCEIHNLLPESSQNLQAIKQLTVWR